VGASTPEESARLSRLASAAPPPLAAKVRSAGSAHLVGERKLVSVLFADVVGSTALAERMDAEDWAGLMNRAFDRLAPAIYRYEGTIARLMGDGLLAFFGAPLAHEDDPVRAVRAALELIEAAHDYATQIRREAGIDFAVRVGLNTGQVVVGNVGSDLIYEYTAMGDAVNLAARMQAAARPMTALITENTYRFIHPLFDCADIGAIQVKGKSEPVHTYEVRGLKPEPGSLRGLAGLESPLIGRREELSSLVRSAEAVQAGLGRVVVVTGEAGLGKTRLIAEWRSRLSPAIQWVEGHSLSYGQGLPYHLFLDALHALLGVPPRGSEPETRAALLQRTGEWFGEAASEVYPYLGHLLSVELEPPAFDQVRRLDPQALQARYDEAVQKTLLAVLQRGPLIMVFEDIHWADPSSVALLARLLPLTSQAPLLFCFTTRPEREVPGWKLVRDLHERLGGSLVELALAPLSSAESQAFVSSLLEVENLPEPLRGLILQKAEGNPFFMEELIRMLIERGAILQKNGRWMAGKAIDSLEIPDNLHGLLLARIDRLPEEVKRTLRVASVIGRQFSARVLEEVLSSAHLLEEA
jgi:class 3 adenylate cyclase